jgi:predicted DNA-binding protein
VKETYESKSTKSISLRHAIKNGVKHVEDGDWLDQDERIGDIIENGVKEIREVTFLNQMFVEETIQDGVKEIGVISNISLMSEIFKVNAKRAIKDGVKELKELPDKSGEFRGYGDYYRKQKDMTKPHTEYVKEVIEDSYNHMGRVEGVIRNTDKDGI